MTDSVLVSIGIAAGPVPVGTAFFTRRRGRLATTFRYNDDYLLRGDAFAIDPSAPLMSGTHHFDGLPRSFQDASPDRWGKNLIAKKLSLQALREQRIPPSISDVDYLLDSDITRQGALRFQTSADGPYLAPDHEVPKLIELPRLLAAADSVSRDAGDLAAVKTLLCAGSGSLGGARPKASVRDGDRLLIAKFPHHHDDCSVGRRCCSTAATLPSR